MGVGSVPSLTTDTSYLHLRTFLDTCRHSLGLGLGSGAYERHCQTRSLGGHPIIFRVCVVKVHWQVQVTSEPARAVPLLVFPVSAALSFCLISLLPRRRSRFTSIDASHRIASPDYHSRLARSERLYPEKLYRPCLARPRQLPPTFLVFRQSPPPQLASTDSDASRALASLVFIKPALRVLVHMGTRASHLPSRTAVSKTHFARSLPTRLPHKDIFRSYKYPLQKLGLEEHSISPFPICLQYLGPALEILRFGQYPPLPLPAAVDMDHVPLRSLLYPPFSRPSNYLH